MTPDLKILDTVSALARHSAERHKVLSQNIANADTPGYRARDLEPFEEFYSQVRQQGGIMPAMGEDAFPVVEMKTHSVISPNGNNVSLDEQTMEAAGAKGQHDMAMAVYRKTLDLFRMALGKNV